jgi:heme-degrading monooxygenase HmoA
MLTRVFIKRQVEAENEKVVYRLLKDLRADAMQQQGYISGETLIRADDPQKIIVISTWHSIDEWNSWKESEQRKNIDAILEKLQVEPTDYEVYVYSKYRIAVKTGFKAHPDDEYLDR